MSFRQDSSHTFYHDLKELSKEFNVYAYHLDPSNTPDDNEIPLVVKNSVFLV